MSKPKKAPAKKKANAYKMPDPLPVGEVLQDIYKQQWILGPSIGKGGFGEIYSAKQADSLSKDYNYVIKIEPHENGPLFVEMHFYTRCARDKDVLAFKEEKQLKHLGMPIYIASGSHLYKEEKYRFIVMQKFGPKDIWKLFIENGRKLPTKTVYRLAIQMLDALEYIHSKGYIHGDIKGANILLDANNANCAFLVDFGLAGKYTSEPTFVPNPKRMHNGTIEYLSRDAHHGVQTRRGDIEILAFNILHWITGMLPWEGNTNPTSVHQEKEKYMNDVTQFAGCFDDEFPTPIKDLLSYINAIKHDQAPDYAKIKKLLQKGLQGAGGNESSPLVFTSTPTASPQKRKATSKQTKDVAAKKRPKLKASSKTNVKQGNGIEDGEAPTSSMNAEELRITALKRAKPAQKKAAKKPVDKKDDSSVDEPIENMAPTSSMMNSEELRITALKASKPTSKKRGKKTVGNESPKRNDLLNVLTESVRRSPRNKGKERPNYNKTDNEDY